MTLLVFGLVGGALLLVIAGLHSQETMRREWESVVRPWAQAAYDDLERRMAGEDRMVAFALRKAEMARAEGVHDEAVHFLNLGLAVVSRLGPERIVRLRGLAVVSRMVAAMTPMAAVQPSRFRTRRLRWLSAAGWAVHRFLVTTAERFRLRAYVLRHGIAIATGRLEQSAERVRSRAGAGDREWREILAACEDLRAISDESLRTFHALMVTMVASRRSP